MANAKLILATSVDGKDISIADCKEYLKTKDKKKLATFIYDRFYGRYLKPFDFPSNEYRAKYKNGFALMTSCCLLIETYVSFSAKDYRNTYRKSAKCFGHFFTTEKRFTDFATGGLRHDGTIANKSDGGTPNDFYENVRCGILHNAETKGGWTITRRSSKPYFDSTTKTINATKFAGRLKAVLSDYKKNLIASDFDTDEIWDTFKNRLDDLFTQS
jgi:hypothetical protein